jgi:hypothetical protein
MPTEQTVNHPDADDANVIGSIRMSVAFSAPSPQDDVRRAQRVDALVEWLLTEWRREHEDTY